MLLLDLFLVALGAVAGGWLCRRVGVPEVLGYLAAGVLLGPGAHPGRTFVETETIRAIAAFAILFRMFTLGLDFDPRRLRGRWRPALTAGLLEMTACTLGGVALAAALGWRPLEGAVLGAALGTTSTNILSRAIADRNMGQREDARAAGAATLTEDLIAMGLIALLTVFSGPTDLAGLLERALGLLVFASLAFTAGAILVPALLDRLGRSRSEELITLAVIGMLFGFAALSLGLGAGVAIGAFLAGVAVGAARHAPGVSARVLPMRDLLAAAAYVSIGLFLDPLVILAVAPIAIPAAIGFVLLKTVAISVGLRLGGVPAVTSARAGAILGQAGTIGLVFVCSSFLDPARVPTLLAFAFVSWAFTVALTPLRLAHGPAFAERLARAVGATDRLPRRRTLRAPRRSEDGRIGVLAFGSAAAIAALAGLAARGAVLAGPGARLPLAVLAGLLAGAAILPFALIVGATSRRLAHARAHETALAPRRLTAGRRDAARTWGTVATLAGLAAAGAIPVAFAHALAPREVAPALLAGTLAGALAWILRPRLLERIVERSEGLARARRTEAPDARLHDFRGVGPFGWEVEAIHVRAGTAAAWRTVAQLDLPRGARVVAVLRQGTHEPAPLSEGTLLHPGDEVVLGGTPAMLVDARARLLAPSTGALEDDAPAHRGQVDAKPAEGSAPRVA